MTVLVTAGKILAALVIFGIIIVLHEFGHFIAAVIFKTRVEKFYMFFNPNFSIFRCKKVHGKWRFAFFRTLNVQRNN